MSEEQTKTADKSPKPGKGEGGAPAVSTDSKLPAIFVLTREGETGFPVGEYASVKDKHGSTGHNFRTVRLQPGLNICDKLIIDQGREALSAKVWEQLQKHPDWERATANGRIVVYDSRSRIPRGDRIAYVKLTVDWLVLEAWAAAEDDKNVKVALREHMEMLKTQGRSTDDTHAPDVPERPGLEATF